MSFAGLTAWASRGVRERIVCQNDAFEWGEFLGGLHSLQGFPVEVANPFMPYLGRYWCGRDGVELVGRSGGPFSPHGHNTEFATQ